MRRKCQNEKVIRAISIGLAAMLAATSTPMAAFAAEGENVGQNAGSGDTTGTQSQGETEEKPTVDSAYADAMLSASTAEGTTGSLDETAKPVTGTGTVGTKAAGALNDIAKGEEAVKAGNDLAKAVGDIETTVETFTADKPGGEGKGQITKAEKSEKKLEGKDAFGVTLDVNSEGKVVVVDRTGLDNKVSDANDKIDKAEKAKGEAYTALSGVKDDIENVNGLIGTADAKKSTADTDTNTANEAKAGLTKLDKDTKDELDKINTALNKAMTDNDIVNAVGQVTQASNDAAQIASDNLTAVKESLGDAKSAADEADANVLRYNRTQMVTLATNAQTAADNAKKAADAADAALKTLEQKETEAKTTLSNAETALTTAQNDAIKVLNDYKKSLGDINGAISTANGSRSEAQKAMKTANDAIDAALLKMGTSSDTSVTGAQEKIAAMNTAIKAANDAINTITSLMYDESVEEKYYSQGISKDERARLRSILEENDLYNAQRNCTNAQTHLTTQANKLEKAKTEYDNVIKNIGDAEANKKKADDAVTEINNIINGINGKLGTYDKLLNDADKDINDLKALLSTGGQSSYADLKKTADDVAEGVTSQGNKLVEASKLLGGSEEDQNLTAEQIVAKYDKAVKDNSETIEPAISAQEKIISDCNSNEGNVKSAYDNANGELRNDITALQAKYVGEYNAETHEFEFKTDKDGKPVYSDSYNALLTRSEATEFKCGDEVLSATAKPAYTDADGNKYMRDGGEDISVPEWIKSDKVQAIVPQAAPVTVVGIDTDANKLVETVPCNFVENYKEGDSVFRSTYYSNYRRGHISCETELTDANEVKKVILAEVLSNVLHAELTTNDVNVNGFTATVTLTKDNASRLQYTQSATEQYTLDLSMYGAPKWTKQDDGSYDLYYNFQYIKFANDGAIYYGAYETTRTYDYKKYEEKSTADAVAAKEELASIDKAADDTAKQQIKGHGETRDEKLKAWNDLINKRADAADALYGYKSGGVVENPAGGSLLDKKAKNDAIISGLGSTISEYRVAVIYKTAADEQLKNADEFDINKAEGISQEDKDKYNAALDARGRIVTAKENATTILETVKTALQTLESNMKSAENGVAKYEAAIGKDGKINAAQKRLDAVNAKLETLKALQKEAVAALKAKSVDDKLVLDDKTTVEILSLNSSLKTTLAGLTKYTPADYDALEYVHPEFMTLDVISIDSLSETLAAAINTASGVIEEQKSILAGLATKKTELTQQVEDIKGQAADAQKEADRANDALRRWRAPEDDSDSTDDSSYDDGTIISQTQGVNLLTLDGIGLPGATNRRGVAGVRNANTTAIGANQIPLAASVDLNNKADSNKVTDDGTGTGKKIGDNLVPLAATPFEDQQGSGMAWLIATLAAAAAGAGGYGYNRRKKMSNNKTDLGEKK